MVGRAGAMQPHERVHREVSHAAIGMAALSLDSMSPEVSDIFHRMNGIVHRSFRMSQTPPIPEESEIEQPAHIHETIGAHFSIADACKDSCSYIFCCMGSKCCDRETITILVAGQREGNDVWPNLVEVEEITLRSADVSETIIASHKALYNFLFARYGEDFPRAFALAAAELRGQGWERWDPEVDTTLTQPLTKEKVNRLLEEVASAYEDINMVKRALRRERIEKIMRSRGLDASSASSHDSVQVSSEKLSSPHSSHDYEPSTAQDTKKLRVLEAGGTGEGAFFLEERSGVSQARRPLKEEVSFESSGAGPAEPTPSGETTLQPKPKETEAELGSGSSQTRNIIIEIPSDGGDSLSVPFNRQKLKDDIEALVICTAHELEVLVDRVMAQLHDKETKTRILRVVTRVIKDYPRKQDAKSEQIKAALTEIQKPGIDKVTELTTHEIAELRRHLRKSLSGSSDSSQPPTSSNRFFRAVRKVMTLGRRLVTPSPQGGQTEVARSHTPSPVELTAGSQSQAADNMETEV